MDIRDCGLEERKILLKSFCANISYIYEITDVEDAVKVVIKQAVHDVWIKLASIRDPEELEVILDDVVLQIYHELLISGTCENVEICRR